MHTVDKLGPGRLGSRCSHPLSPSSGPLSRPQVRNEKARRFLMNMRKKPGIPFEQYFPKADKGALRLLWRLLAFDPAERPTAGEPGLSPQGGDGNNPVARDELWLQAQGHGGCVMPGCRVARASRPRCCQPWTCAPRAPPCMAWHPSPAAEEALADPYFAGLSQPSREPSAQPISKLAFEFERRKLVVEEVRAAGDERVRAPCGGPCPALQASCKAAAAAAVAQRSPQSPPLHTSQVGEAVLRRLSRPARAACLSCRATALAGCLAGRIPQPPPHPTPPHRRCGS